MTPAILLKRANALNKRLSAENALYDAKHEAIWRKAVKIALKYDSMGSNELEKESTRLYREVDRKGDSPELMKQAAAFHKKMAKDMAKLLPMVNKLLAHIDTSKLDGQNKGEYMDAKAKADKARNSIKEGPRGALGREVNTKDTIYMAGFDLLGPVTATRNLGTIRWNLHIY